MIPYYLLCLCCFFWSLNFIIGKIVVGAVPPITISLFRWGLPLLVFAWFLRSQIKHYWPQVKQRWLLILWLGATGYSVNGIAVYEAVAFTSTINTSFINAFNPVLIALTGYVLYGYPTTIKQVIGFLISLAGVTWIIFRGDPGMIIRLEANIGDLFMVGSIATWSLHTCCYKRYSSVLPDNLLFVLMMLGGTIVTLPLAAIENYVAGMSWLYQVEFRHIIGMISLSVFPSVLAFRFWNQALQKVDANKVAAFQYLIPVYTVIISVLVLDEKLQAFQIVGGGLIFIGVLLVTAKKAESRLSICPNSENKAPRLSGSREG